MTSRKIIAEIKALDNQSLLEAYRGYQKIEYRSSADNSMLNHLQKEVLRRERKIGRCLEFERMFP